jgi:hypothetical protein
MPSYRIADEPAPSGLAHLAVNPIWPLFAIMFGGSWLSWPWFVVNAWAMGSPTRVREALLAAGGFAGNVLVTIGFLLIYGLKLAPEWTAPYLLIFFSGWKLGISYVLFTRQSRTFGLFEYYGGRPRNGMPMVLLGFLARSWLDLPPLLVLVLG